ncbi:MAG: universal stress protein [Deltaproteobacteria bacterium]|nr:universal stress protein [Deltaproteobacteria bacterium]
MKILFAGDDRPYSAYALKKVIELARNTWADVTILGVAPTSASKDVDIPLPSNHALIKALHRYRQEFDDELGQAGSPYAQERFSYEWKMVKSGLWEEMKVYRGARKDLKIRLRAGHPANEILNEAKKEGSDLIVLGCSKGSQCLWQDPADVPQAVVGNADCSVLLVKEDKPIKRIMACIEDSTVSQDSLEMINQMATIHQARLELVGLTKDGAAKQVEYTKLIEVGDYFSDRGISVKNRLAEMKEFEAVIAKETDDDLLAFWMGKKSLLSVLFPKDWMDRFLSTCQSSVLVLR